MRKVILTIASSVVCLSITTGCASWTADKPKNKDSIWSSMQFWKKPYQTPSQLAAIWTPDTLTMSGKPATRGFGGRVYFYNADSKAIAVEGELIVHGYEESKSIRKSKSDKVEADKTFVFTQEQFSSHYSPSELGASYSIWIPWEGVEGMQREICLIPTFKASNGAIVQGEPAKLVLQGRTADPTMEQVSNRFSIQESQSPTVQADLPNANRSLRTTTISVPSQANRLTRSSSKSRSTDSNSSAIKETKNPYGGFAVGGGAGGSSTRSTPENATIVNDLNSNPLAQRSYNLTANAAAYAAAVSSASQAFPTQNLTPQSLQSPTAQVGQLPTSPNVPVGMPNMIQHAPGSMPTYGQGAISPASFQNITPPQTLPNQAAAPAFPMHAMPMQTASIPAAASQPAGNQPWQPFGQPAIPLINPNAPHYSANQAFPNPTSPHQAVNAQTIPASATATAQSPFQVQTTGFDGIQQPGAVITAWGQGQPVQVGQTPVPAQLAAPQFQNRP